MREKILFDDNWKFHCGDINIEHPAEKGPVYISSKTERMKWGPASRFFDDNSDNYAENKCLTTELWESVNLPHDYIIRQEPKYQNNNTLGFFKYENAWYRKRFMIGRDDENKRITLFFEGVTVDSTVYINGCLLYHNFCGYTSFEVDITDYILIDEENVVAVYVKNEHNEGWWYEGGGIYRHVWLVKTDKVSVDLWGVYVNPQKIADEEWEVNIETTILNDDYLEKLVRIKHTIVDKNSDETATVSGSVTVDFRDKITFKTKVSVKNPLIWDIDSPNLYTIRTELETADGEADCVVERFGFRTFGFDPQKGFFLNDKHMKIQGVCSHQDFGITGKAVPDNIFKYRIQMLKEMGANGYRTSHYPHSQATMDALDELGMVVMNETRWFDSTKEGKEQLEMLIKRDRNRPSVIMWSVGNEEPFFVTEQGRRICKSLMAFAKKIDNTRPVMSAVSHSPDEATVYDVQDVIGINYNLDKYDYVHKKYPNHSIFASECCATSSTRGWYYETSVKHGYMSAYDTDTNQWFLGREKTWKFLCEHEWVAGGFQWIGFEHRGETMWPRVCSQAGAIDLFLQKKPAYYQNKSHWTKEPMAYIIPHWNFIGREGETIRVVVYTNCEELELFQDGRSLGRKEIERFGHGEWNVVYTPGKLAVKGYNKGVEVVAESIETTGEAIKLMLRIDNKIEYANGKDIAVITCYCVDDQGRMVPDASPTITFISNSLGEVVGTGSDVCDHVPTSSPTRRMRAGLCTAAVKVSDKPGSLKVYAESHGLISGFLEIDIK